MVIKPVAEIREDLEQKLAETKSDQSDSTYWHTLWQIVSGDDSKMKSLKGVRLLIQNLVLPDLQYSLQMGEKVQKLAAVEDEPGVPATRHSDNGP